MTHKHHCTPYGTLKYRIGFNPILRLQVLALLALCLSPVTRAQKQTLTVDPARSEVQFSLQASLHAVHGTFHIQSGSVAFLPAKAEMSGSILVDATSGNSGEASRDKKMTHDQLKADQFTTVTFQPKSFTGNLAPEGDSTITVQGIFTLLGTPHEIAVPMSVHIDHTACKATGSFAVPFTKWGVKDPSTFLLKVGKEVTVNLDLEGTLSAAGTE